MPQICAACHNPHDTGSFSGGPDTNARVRVNGDGGTCGDATCDTYELTRRLHGDDRRQGCDLHDLPQLAARPAQ